MSTVYAGIKFGFGLTLGSLGVCVALSPLYVYMLNKTMKNYLQEERN